MPERAEYLGYTVCSRHEAVPPEPTISIIFKQFLGKKKNNSFHLSKVGMTRMQKEMTCEKFLRLSSTWKLDYGRALGLCHDQAGTG